MLNIRLICVGKLKERFYAEAVAEYAKRLGAFCRLEVIELAEERLGENPSAAELEAALKEDQTDLEQQKEELAQKEETLRGLGDAGDRIFGTK